MALKAVVAPALDQAVRPCGFAYLLVGGFAAGFSGGFAGSPDMTRYLSTNRSVSKSVLDRHSTPQIPELAQPGESPGPPPRRCSWQRPAYWFSWPVSGRAWCCRTRSDPCLGSAWPMETPGRSFEGLRRSQTTPWFPLQPKKYYIEIYQNSNYVNQACRQYRAVSNDNFTKLHYFTYSYKKSAVGKQRQHRDEGHLIKLHSSKPSSQIN